jgi:glucokinase
MTAPSSLIKMANGDLQALDGPMVTTAAKEGDSVAIEAFGQIGYWLAQGVADLVQLLDPQVIVIGGGVIEAGDLLMKPLRAAYTDALTQRGKLHVADLRPAEMGNEAGLIGAADLARSR